MEKSGGIWFGLILIAIGVLLLLDNMDIVDFSEVVHTYWPVLIVLLGLSLLLRRSSPRRGDFPHAASGAPVFDASRISASTVFGDHTVSVQSKSFTGGTVSTTFGDIDVDLLNAELAEGEHFLKIDGVFGDTTLRLSKGTAFAVHASTTFGDVSVNEQSRGGVSPSLDYATPDFEGASRRLRIFVSRVFGDVTVLT